MSNQSVPSVAENVFLFLGVTTGSSWINKIFPLWMAELGRADVHLRGIDLQIHDDPANYRAVVQQAKSDAQILGGLVTTHKLDLFAAAHDLFDHFGPYAAVTAEISCIAKQAGQLQGFAKDPAATALAADSLLGEAYFAGGPRDVLCLGAGGAGLATLLQFIERSHPADRPRRFIAVDILQSRLDHMRQTASRFETDIDLRLLLNGDPRLNDTLIAELPPGSVIVNATGLGKDRPGSPITDNARFPEGGVVWEFNYRGERQFMQQALRAAARQDLRVADGWILFLHGWTQVIAEVLHIDLQPRQFERLRAIAEAERASG